MKLKLGKVVATPGVMRSVSDAEMIESLRRHGAGDWGDVCEEDKLANDDSLREGSRVLSSYKTMAGVKFWVITESDRSSTTLLLPEEY